MTTIHYQPAASDGWAALVAGPRVLLLGGAPTAELIADALVALADDDGVARALDLLTRAGLSATPPFAVLEQIDTDVRLVVRGGVEIVAGGEVVSGRGLATWAERRVTGIDDAEVRLSDAAVAVDAPILPLVHGAAWVATLRLSVGVAPAAAVARAAVSQAELAHARPATVVLAAVAPASIADERGAPANDSPASATSAVETPVDDSPALTMPDESTLVVAPADERPGEPSPAAGEPTPGEGYDFLFGATVVRPVSAAAMIESPPESEPSPVASAGPSPSPGAGDAIDEHTVVSTRRGRAGANVTPPTPAAPVLVSIELADGTSETLETSMLVGRAPSVSQVSGGSIPLLVTIGSGDQDISRTHARLSLEGGTVVVTDLHSRNGTTVRMPGRDAQKLRAGEPTSVIADTVIDLGGGVTLTVRERAASEA